MIIAIDVGGTKISAALISSSGVANGNVANANILDLKIVKQRKIESVIHSDLINLSDYLVELCQGWLEQATHVSIACTGQIGVEYVNFLSAKQNLPLKAQLESAFKLPITIINDAAAAAWAEYSALNKLTAEAHEDSNTSHVNHKRDDSLVYITVSTGIGGGMIQNGQLVTCTDGFCAHLGHVSVQHGSQQSIQCHCGRVNCAEAIASGTAIAKQASVILNKTVSCKEVFEHYLAVPEIANLVDDASSAICDLIANIKAVTGTRIVVLGGSVGSVDIFQQQIQAKVAKLPTIFQVSIIPPQMGADADLLGAAFYAHQYSNII
ncbi:ROK family protein [Shewanella eurypsychrophilus]|uniref:ROK family protein n=1 Tax=Shewanella eurypsychrophilus TaxID=2593656 RepID=A0ABX6VA69_9GAMM|nr:MULTISPECIES: ROK family protein [Shewanella]QFU22097.1 ROK family protein [Shewanella sp. YLB-09]QPG57385.1 ROK family protein [Shewanella eurypsychrophilus]